MQRIFFCFTMLVLFTSCPEKLRQSHHGDKAMAPPPGRSVSDAHLTTERPWLNFSRVKVAAAQIEFSSGHEMETIARYIVKAATDSAQIIVFPEYILGTFFRDSSPRLQMIKKLALEHGIYVVIGGWEEFEKNAYSTKKKDAFANAALIIDRKGEIIGRYYKIHKATGKPPYDWPPIKDQDEYLMKAGDGFPVFQLDFAKIGIMICYDGYFAECPASLSLQGAEIIIWINGRESVVQEYMVKTDVWRNYCAEITTNFAAGGGTYIASWPSDILAGYMGKGEHYISAEIDMDALRVRRKNSRVFHQRRPEIYGNITCDHQPWDAYEGWEPPE